MVSQTTQNYSSDELEILASALRYQDWVAEQFASFLRGRIMEIGAGIGTMARHWLKFAREVYLLEPASNLFASLDRTYSSTRNITLHNSTLENAVTAHGPALQQSFDAVIMINVLEHIEDDAKTLITIRDLLRPDGNLLIFVPAMPALYGSLDRQFGHYRRYTKPQLTRLVRESGYELVKVYYFDILGMIPWWFVNRVLSLKHLNPRMALLYDRLGVPLSRAVERLIHPPFGKNLILVAKKSSVEAGLQYS